MAVERNKLPSRRHHQVVTLRLDGRHIIVGIGRYADGRIGEVFVDHAKEGSFARDVLAAFAKSISISLQYGIPLEALAHSFRDHLMSPDWIRGIFEILEKESCQKQEQELKTLSKPEGDSDSASTAEPKPSLERADADTTKNSIPTGSAE